MYHRVGIRIFLPFFTPVKYCLSSKSLYHYNYSFKNSIITKNFDRSSVWPSLSSLNTMFRIELHEEIKDIFTMPIDNLPASRYVPVVR